MRDFSLFAYLPILLMFLVAAGFAVSQVMLSTLMGQRKRTRTKLMPYECGKDPVGSARERFSVKFYLVAVDFILFDVEVIFLVPFAVAFAALASAQYGLGVVSYIAVMIFLFFVVVGFAYTWAKGSFEWSERARREAKAEARVLAQAASSRTAELGKATARRQVA